MDAFPDSWGKQDDDEDRLSVWSENFHLLSKVARNQGIYNILRTGAIELLQAVGVRKRILRIPQHVQCRLQ